VDLANGLAITVELDEGDTLASLCTLEDLLGPATIVVLSGGIWADPDTGELHPKRHAYWRLTEPTTDQKTHDLLAVTRHYAALLAGADPTGAAPVHCFRWPGSVHTKNPLHPVLCTIERINEAAEVDLIEAAEKLAEAVEAQGMTRGGNGSGQPQRGALPRLDRVAETMAPIPNTDVPYQEWVAMAYAVFGATAGQGFNIFERWSAKSAKHNDAETVALWARIRNAGHVRAGYGTIRRLAERTRGNGQDHPRPGTGGDRPPSPEDGGGGAGGDEGEGPGPGAEPGPLFLDPPWQDMPEPELPELPDDPLRPNDVLLVFNARYAVVNDAGKALIYEKKYDPALRRRYFNYIGTADFGVLYANRLVTVHTKKGKPIVVSAAKLWLEHPQRRQFLGGAVFQPGQKTGPDTLNLWRGFGITPRPRPWNLLQEHIRHIICRDDEKLDAWLLDWMARMVQQPGEQGYICVVLCNPEEGSGKSLLGRILCRLMGTHHLAISNPEHLVGRFNSHLRDCVFLLGEEAFYADNKKHMGVLKALISEDTMAIEAKYRNLVSAANCLHIMLTSNAAQVIWAALSARRYAVFNPSSKRVGDAPYFNAILAQMEEGGYAGMLHDLLNRDLSKFNPRMAPETEGLQEQKKLSLDTEEAWLFDVLHRGYVWQSKLGLEEYFSEWHDEVTREVLYASYAEFAKERRSRILPREMLGKFILQMGGQATYPRKAVTGEHIVDVIDHKTQRIVRREAQLVRPDRAHAYHLGDLITCRTKFAAETKLPIDWPPDQPSTP
jgi:hypothetical protein